MFQPISRLSPDPILGVMAKFRADPSPRKVDLGVGVFRDLTGNTPILDCVRRAEQRVLASQTTKSYVSAAGREEFNVAVEELVLGSSHAARRDRRVRTLQAPGGCGALRVGAELIRAAAPSTTVYVSDPTWGNHIPLLGSSGLRLERYPYYHAPTHELRFDSMLERLDRAAAGDVVLVHACCHNPTGADLTPRQWESLVALLARRRLIPFLDLADQGFVSGNESQADAVNSHMLQIARSIYSMPPDHGAAIAACIFGDADLNRAWVEELSVMRNRIKEMRALLAQHLRSATGTTAFDFIQAQHGMFSLLGVPTSVVDRLRDEHHIYMTADSRMNLAGIMPDNAAYVAESIGLVQR